MSITEIEKIVSNYLDVDCSELHKDTWTKQSSECKNFVILFSKDLFNHKHKDIGAYFNRSKTTIRHSLYDMRKQVVIYSDYGKMYEDLIKILVFKKK